MASHAATGVPSAVRVIDVESVPLVERAHVRAGGFSSRRLLTGEAGTPGNFSLQLSVTPESYYSPRHRHNFDQVRYQIEGDFDFASDGIMKPGTVAYFPEGTYYGPQQSSSRSVTLVLQFGGASGSGYLSAEEYEKAAAELARLGAFAKGVYTRVLPDGRKINQDAYESVWEHVKGRPLVYPAERYSRPVFMSPENFGWTADARQSGVSRKFLGEFSERHARIAFVRIDAGAKCVLNPHSIFFVSRGNGVVGPQTVRPHATIFLEEGTPPAMLTASDSTELLYLGLPRFTESRDCV